MANKSGKGSGYERDFCRLLSLWWTDGKRDDIFWRTGGSGGRANVRFQRGHRTAGQYGDICATDLIGEPLLDLVTIELKRGYTIRKVKGVKKKVSGVTIADLLDKPAHAAQLPFEEWLQQAILAHEQAGSYAWWLVQRRDSRRAVLFMPNELFGLFDGQCDGHLGNILTLRVNDLWIAGVALDSFLKEITPRMVRDVARVV